MSDDIQATPTKKPVHSIDWSQVNQEDWDPQVDTRYKCLVGDYPFNPQEDEHDTEVSAMMAKELSAHLSEGDLQRKIAGGSRIRFCADGTFAYMGTDGIMHSRKLNEG